MASETLTGRQESRFQIIPGDGGYVYATPILGEVGDGVQTYNLDCAVAMTAIAHSIARGGHAPFGYTAGFGPEQRPSAYDVVTVMAGDRSPLAQAAISGMMEISTAAA